MFYFTKETKEIKEKVNEFFKTLDPVIKNGRVILQERTEDLNKGLTYDDFSLQSLLDADATDLLLPIAPISGSLLATADIANSAATAIGDYSDNMSVQPNKDENK